MVGEGAARSRKSKFVVPCGPSTVHPAILSTRHLHTARSAQYRSVKRTISTADALEDSLQEELVSRLGQAHFYSQYSTGSSGKMGFSRAAILTAAVASMLTTTATQALRVTAPSEGMAVVAGR